MITTAVFPVAGLGTRFLPATKAIPKEMMIVDDRPLIQHAVEEASSCGITRFIFVTSPSKSSIADHFDKNIFLEEHLYAKGKKQALASLQQCTLPQGQAIFTYQQQPLGLGHAVSCALPWLEKNEAFCVILPDDYIYASSSPPCLAQMISSYASEKNQDIMVATLKVPLDQTSSYGILDVDTEKGNIILAKDIVEKPHPAQAPSTYAVIGRYILPPTIFHALSTLQPGAGGELQLTDAIRATQKAGTPLKGYIFEGKRFDCGSKEGWIDANRYVFDQA